MTAFTWRSAFFASGNWSAAQNWMPSGGPPDASTDTVLISSSDNPSPVILDVSETIGALTFSAAAAQMEIPSGSQLTITDAGGQAGTLIVNAGDAIRMDGGTLSTTGGIQLNSAGTSPGIAGDGTLIGAISGGGEYLADAGLLRINGPVLASVTSLQIANGGADAIELDSTVASGASILFEDPVGTLILTDISGDVLQGFNGTIAGLYGQAPSKTNQIDLAGLPIANIIAANLDTTTDVVTVTTTGGPFTLQLSGTYGLLGQQHVFVDRTADAAGTGSDIYLSTVACFRHGTHILTNHGEVAVERLAIGDHVTTISGKAMPVKWVGHRRVCCENDTNPREVWPVRIAAGAFGPGRPHTELWLSPDHAVYVNEVLIPVKHMINGTTIAQVQVDTVTYYHIELPRHDVMLAEGLTVESYLDMKDGSNYANRPGPVRRYPDFSTRMWEAFGCARLVVTGAELAEARALVRESVRD